MDLMFLRPPAALELLETYIFRPGSSEAEALKTLVSKKLDRLPHDQIVSPKFLVFAVGSPIFVNHVITVVEEDRASDIPAIVRGKDDTPKAPGNDMVVKFSKKI